MPTAAPKPCKRCGVLVHGGGMTCELHRTAREGTFADKRRGTRQQRGYGAAWERLRDQALVRDAGLCQPCAEAARVTVGTEVDHRVPKAQGGTDELANLQAICTPCHRAKTSQEARRARGGASSLGDADAAGQVVWGGGPISEAAGRRTDRFAVLSRAGVSGGGVPPVAGEGSA